MSKSSRLVQVAGFEVRIVSPYFWVSTIGMMLVFSTVGYWVGLEPTTAVPFGIGAMLLSWSSQVLHNVGHGLAARMTGYPMLGVALWGLGTSLYPKNEPTLPARVHIQRALGGPIFSILLGFIGLLILSQLTVGTLAYALTAYFAGGNLTFWGLSALLPLEAGEFSTDGGTIVHWLRKR